MFDKYYVEKMYLALASGSPMITKTIVAFALNLCLNSDNFEPQTLLVIKPSANDIM
jgi:hypothetical protein